MILWNKTTFGKEHPKVYLNQYLKVQDGVISHLIIKTV